LKSGFTHWLITRRSQLFADAQAHVTSCWLLHRVEETEHKSVAFDVGPFALRALSLVATTDPDMPVPFDNAA